MEDTRIKWSEIQFGCQVLVGRTQVKMVPYDDIQSLLTTLRIHISSSIRQPRPSQLSMQTPVCALLCPTGAIICRLLVWSEIGIRVVDTSEKWIGCQDELILWLEWKLNDLIIHYRYVSLTTRYWQLYVFALHRVRKVIWISLISPHHCSLSSWYAYYPHGPQTLNPRGLKWPSKWRANCLRPAARENRVEILPKLHAVFAYTNAHRSTA